MPLSKEDLQRALSIFESLIAQAESKLDSDQDQQSKNTDELLQSLSTLQSTVDMLSSPLFSSLLEIKQQCKQRCQSHPSPVQNTTNSTKSTELKLDSDPSLLSQFRQTYGITDSEVHTNRSAVSSLAAEALEDASFEPTSPHTPTGSFPSTFVGDRLHEKSTRDTKTAKTNQQRTQKKSSSKSKKKYSHRALASRRGNVSLADLASSVPATAGKELRDAFQEPSITLKSTLADSCESSLSSFTSDATYPSLDETIQQPTAAAKSQSKTPQILKSSLREEALQSCEETFATTEEEHRDTVKQYSHNQSIPDRDSEQVQRREHDPVCTESAGMEGTPVCTESAGTEGTPVCTESTGTEGTPVCTESTGTEGTPVCTESTGTEGTPVCTESPGTEGTPVCTESTGTEGTPVCTESTGTEGTPVCTENPGTEGTPVCTESSGDTQREGMASEVVVTNAVEEVDGPKDVLFFMRDSKSQTELREGFKSKEPRTVTIELPDGGRGLGLGMDLAGVSSTGVFVNELYPGGVAQCSGKIQMGDQVLKFNGHDTGNMASFEVEMLIREVPSDGKITFVLKYNPIGWIEYQRLRQQ